MSRQQNWQWRKLKDGLCRQCGKRPVALRSTILCPVCREKFRARIAAQRAKARSFLRGSPVDDPVAGPV